MLESTLDSISQAVSNHLYVFCVFNLIIVMILMGSKHDQDYEIPLPAATTTYDKQLLNRREQESSADDTVTQENRENRYGCNASANNTDDADEDGEGEGERDDELRKKVEEFIAKVNREWRAEKLEMSILA